VGYANLEAVWPACLQPPPAAGPRPTSRYCGPAR